MPIRSLSSSGSVLALAGSLLLTLAACGGSVSTVGGSSGSNDGSSSGSSGSSGAGSSSGSSGSSGVDEGTCTQQTLPGDRACVPGTAIAGQPIKVAIDASEGCLGCFTAFEPCDVTVGPGTVTLAMRTRTCPPPGDQACPAVCQSPQTTCIIPPLAAGTYTVSVTGEGPRTNLPPRELVVADGAGASSCTLPLPGQGPAPIDGSTLSRSCSQDSDCQAAVVGNQCQPCFCPTTAISTSAVPQLEEEQRAKRSQCPVTQGGVACAACAAPVVHCAIDPSALTGTCELVK